jgi:uncharacterized membrane protein (UPF0127 family)
MTSKSIKVVNGFLELKSRNGENTFWIRCQEIVEIVDHRPSYKDVVTPYSNVDGDDIVIHMRGGESHSLGTNSGYSVESLLQAISEGN